MYSFNNRADVAEVGAQFLGGDGGIVPSLPFRRCAGRGRCRARPGFTYLPDSARLGRVIEPGGRRIRKTLQILQKPERGLGRLVSVVVPELHEQEAAALRKQVEIGCSLPAKAVHDGAFETLEADRLETENARHVIGSREGVPVPQSDQRSVWWAVDQPELCLEDDRARAFGAYERARDVKAAFGEQFVEVVAGYPPRNVGKACPNLVGVAVANRAKPSVDLAPTSPRADDAVEFAVVGAADGHLRPVVEQNAKLFDVIDRLAGQQRMRAARVVADHSAERAPAVRRGIGPESQLKGFRTAPQRVEDDAGLNAREPLGRVDLEDLIHVFREIQHDGHVAALAGQARPSAPWQHRCTVLPACGDGRNDIVGVFGNDQADRYLSIIRPVCRVECAAAAVEPHFAADRLFQLALERLGPGKRVDWLGMGA